MINSIEERTAYAHRQASAYLYHPSPRVYEATVARMVETGESVWVAGDHVLRSFRLKTGQVRR